jgi:hypothetical protein
MSIDDIKKKSKLSLDEMLDNQSVGKTVKQDTVQQNSNNKSLLVKTDYRSDNSTEKSKTIKYPCKMTFYMTQEIYDAFNHIYAQRLIEKKKVDKGALFCEMVQSFIENEGD